SDMVSVSLINGAKPMVHITTKYEIAASHRLFNAEWDDNRNNETFGKCAHPTGHGHNYVLEVTVAGEPQVDTVSVATVESINAIVQQQIIDRFDHKNLNADCKDFRDLIPTVENMARVFWDLLVGRFGPAQLARIAIWETPHTYAEYFGPAAGPLRYGEFV
ncbi:MAG: 6-carboxytetrahydropterin synthase, partial [Sedimentisphaerales bacterium]|nr:6-carboxytetrahydropterin synthase [Sedimentisphaerales bacterium]